MVNGNRRYLTIRCRCHARIQEFSSGGGGPGQSDKKSSDRSQMVNFKEIYHFSRFQRGSNIFQGGGVQLFPGGGGSNSLFPIETHITCDFPGGVRTTVPPSGSALGCRLFILTTKNIPKYTGMSPTVTGFLRQLVNRF